MYSAAILAQALCIAYVAGLDLYATVAMLGIGTRFGWIQGIPGELATVGSLWIIIPAIALYVVELVMTSRPGVAAAWETVHSLIRPPAAAALAAATAWHGDPILVLLAALGGGAVAASTHATKLGFRYAIDSSPARLSNIFSSVIQLAVIFVMLALLGTHPFLALLVGLVLLVSFIVIVRFVWRSLQAVFSGHWAPSCGFLQEPRTSPSAPVVDSANRERQH